MAKPPLQQAADSLQEMLLFISDVTPSCAAGHDWLQDIKHRATQAIAAVKAEQDDKHDIAYKIHLACSNLTLAQNRALIAALQTAEGGMQQAMNGSLSSQNHYDEEVVRPAWNLFEKALRGDKFTMDSVRSIFASV